MKQYPKNRLIIGVANNHDPVGERPRLKDFNKYLGTYNPNTGEYYYDEKKAGIRQGSAKKPPEHSNKS